MKLTIIKDSDPKLREKSKPVPMPLSDKHRKLLLAMIDYLAKSQDEEYATKHHLREGVGLAAPQVGHNIRMIAIHFQKDERAVSHGLVNPIVVASSVKLTYLGTGEGCLSVDEVHEGYVYRPYKVTVKAFDVVTNQDVALTFRGFDAIVVQHEIDHLDGILFYDRIDKANPFKLLENAEIAQ